LKWVDEVESLGVLLLFLKEVIEQFVVKTALGL